MNITAWARASRGPLRTTALTCAALMSGAALLLAGCSASGGAAGQAARGASAAGLSHNAASGVPAAPLPAANSPQPSSAAPAARLALASQSIIFTASLTVQAANVNAAATQAAGIVTAFGGYVSGEHLSAPPADHARATARLQLKIPVARYPAALSELSARLGTRMSLNQQAQDVTQQVADVSSLVTSAQAAITQLQALLKRAGSVPDLLSVQDQINAQESSLEALIAQQRALSDQTSYATVSVTLVGPHPKAVRARKKQQQQHGFVAGLAAGWRGLRNVVSAVLTAAGAVLPFAAVAAVLGLAGYAGRRRLLRLLRRGSRPTTAG